MAAALGFGAAANVASADPSLSPSPDATRPTSTPTAAEGPKQNPVSGGFELDHANTWNLDVEGAGGSYFGSEDRWTGFARIRAGVLFVRDPIYDTIGLTYEYSSLTKATFGLQAEWMRIDAGFWLQLGGLLDANGHPGATVSGGWSIFGIEGQVRAYDGLGTGVAAFAKLRLPIGVIAHVLTRPRFTPP